jgi:hypothetical protein
MTEAEWLASEDAASMEFFIRDRASDRKARLYCCAVCRHVWSRLEHDSSRQAVVVGERFADGTATRGELRAARQSARAVVNTERDGEVDRLHYTAVTAADPRVELEWVAINANGGVDSGTGPFAELLRDIYGDPFRPVALGVAGMPSGVTLLAQAAYDNRILPGGELDLAHLGVLSDALEEAGCTDVEILSHLRSPGPHVRGCWALDLVLGKS